MASSPNVSIRPGEQADIKFIMNSWKLSWRTCPWAGCIRNDEYFASITSTIEGLVARGAEFSVAYLESQPEAILGWGCFEVLTDGKTCCHYIYVKDPYLRMNIGERLVEHAPGTKPGFYTFRFRQVVDACPGWKHAAEIARRK